MVLVTLEANDFQVHSVPRVIAPGFARGGDGLSRLIGSRLGLLSYSTV